MTDQEKQHAVCEMIRALKSMQAHEIVHEAESLQMLNELLAYEGTLGALLVQVKARNRAKRPA